ncbi:MULTISPECIES: hypothetical protein [Flavobacteriaceae]|uniref:Uncharacterized protein n=2 Tax=Flavobacteriaceae TaxID=49546 RepID=A0A4Y8ASQ8_9FLAO|nr:MULTISPECIES: hypothetical protein [Flavobacteriaceae]TEW74888.1 hypothetical protein E2488_05005 [Gramella jeungdoensis]
MKYLYSFLLLILFLSFSCNKTKKLEEVVEVADTLVVEDTDRIINNTSETLIPAAKRSLKDWKEYQKLDQFMLKYYNVSNLEALNNAKELSGLVKNMIDTIRVEKLTELNVVARFNVLHNETLRLADMATIRSISKEEVKEEVKKIIDLYSAVNSKINTIYEAEDLQSSLEVDTEEPINDFDVLKKKLESKRKRPSRIISRQ